MIKEKFYTSTSHIRTKYWVDVSTGEIYETEESGKYVENQLNVDRPATYEEVEKYKSDKIQHMREVVESKNSKYRWKKQSAHYHSHQLGMRTLYEAYEIEIKN